MPIDLDARRDGVPGPPRRIDVGAKVDPDENDGLVGVLRSNTHESRERGRPEGAFDAEFGALLGKDKNEMRTDNESGRPSKGHSQV